MGKCEHGYINYEEINTRLDGKIIDTNYQCTQCANIIDTETMQEFLTDDCTLCDGNGYHIEQGHSYKCGCKLRI